MKSPIDDTLRQMLQAKLEALEQYLNADVFVYCGRFENRCREER